MGYSYSELKALSKSFADFCKYDLGVNISVASISNCTYPSMPDNTVIASGYGDIADLLKIMKELPQGSTYGYWYVLESMIVSSEDELEFNATLVPNTEVTPLNILAESSMWRALNALQSKEGLRFTERCVIADCGDYASFTFVDKGLKFINLEWWYNSSMRPLRSKNIKITKSLTNSIKDLLLALETVGVDRVFWLQKGVFNSSKRVNCIVKTPEGAILYLS